MKDNKNHTKKLAVYSINKDLLKKFNEIAKKKATNKSGLVELLIESWIEEQKRKDKQ